MRASTLARPEQTKFPFTAQEAAHTARLWFAHRKPSMTLAAWRDHFLKLHLDALCVDDWQERIHRKDTWNNAFNGGVAQAIAEGAR